MLQIRTWAEPAAMAQTMPTQFSRISPLVANRKRRKKETGGGSFEGAFSSTVVAFGDFVSCSFPSTASTGADGFLRNMVKTDGGIGMGMRKTSD